MSADKNPKRLRTLVAQWLRSKRGEPTEALVPAATRSVAPTGEGVLVFEDLDDKSLTLADVLGNAADPRRSGLRGENLRRYERPPYEQTKRVKEEISRKVKAMSMEEIKSFITTDIPQYLLELAEIRMPLVDIPSTYWVISAIDSEYQRRLLSEEFAGEEFFSRGREHTPEENRYFSTLRTASGLAYVIPFNEGLFGPNDLGYLPDTTMSIANKEMHLLKDMKRAVEEFTRYPDMFGEETQTIYEGIAARLNRRRAMFMGKRAIPDEFLPFPSSDRRGKKALGQ